MKGSKVKDAMTQLEECESVHIEKRQKTWPLPLALTESHRRAGSHQRTGVQQRMAYVFLPEDIALPGEEKVFEVCQQYCKALGAEQCIHAMGQSKTKYERIAGILTFILDSHFFTTSKSVILFDAQAF